MSTLNVDKVDPSTGTALEIGSSGDTITVPSGATFAVSGTMNASSITAGTVATARLGSGTADGTTFLRGDQTYAAPGGGITEADMWRLHTAFTGDANPITTNFERNDTAGFSQLGTGMTESSGVFTFPSTGIWWIAAQWFNALNNAECRYIFNDIVTTVDDGSNWVLSGRSATSLGYFENSWTHISGYNSVIFDVTSTSTHKVRFEVTLSNTDTTTGAHTDRNDDGFTFIRLGDT